MSIARKRHALRRGRSIGVNLAISGLMRNETARAIAERETSAADALLAC
jgi:hypothetical protein